jgi:hypothetical protein
MENARAETNRPDTITPADLDVAFAGDLDAIRAEFSAAYDSAFVNALDTQEETLGDFEELLAAGLATVADELAVRYDLPFGRVLALVTKAGIAPDVTVEQLTANAPSSSPPRTESELILEEAEDLEADQAVAILRIELDEDDLPAGPVISGPELPAGPASASASASNCIKCMAAADTAYDRAQSALFTLTAKLDADLETARTNRDAGRAHWGYPGNLGHFAQGLEDLVESLK